MRCSTTGGFVGIIDRAEIAVLRGGQRRKRRKRNKGKAREEESEIRVSRFQILVYFRIFKTVLNQHLAKVKLTLVFKNWGNVPPVILRHLLSKQRKALPEDFKAFIK